MPVVWAPCLRWMHRRGGSVGGDGLQVAVHEPPPSIRQRTEEPDDSEDVDVSSDGEQREPTAPLAAAPAVAGPALSTLASLISPAHGRDNAISEPGTRASLDEEEAAGKASV